MCPPAYPHRLYKLLELILELQLVQLEEMRMSKEVLDRITAAVVAVGEGIAEVAAAIKAHPAAQNDDDQLNALAGQLETAANQLVGLSHSIGQVQVPDPAPQPAPDPATEPAPGGDTTGGAEVGGEGAPTGGEQAPSS